MTHAKWYGAPGPMYCGPKTDEQPFTGFWDHLYECKSVIVECCLVSLLASTIATHILCCLLPSASSLPGNKSWANPPESCDIYEGQKAGRYDQSSAYASTGERSSIQHAGIISFRVRVC